MSKKNRNRTNKKTNKTSQRDSNCESGLSPPEWAKWSQNEGSDLVNAIAEQRADGDIGWEPVKILGRDFIAVFSRDHSSQTFEQLVHVLDMYGFPMKHGIQLTPEDGSAQTFVGLFRVSKDFIKDFFKLYSMISRALGVYAPLTREP